jgi:hypothetical protein
MLKIPTEYDRGTLPAKLTDFFAKFLLLRLLGVSARIFRKAVVDESGMIRTQMETYNRSDNDRSSWDALYDTIP